MPEKKLNKEADDKVISPEQAILNSAITQAAALVEISECLNDMVETLDVIRTIEVKRALKDGIIAPDEADDMTITDNDDDDDGEN